METLPASIVFQLPNSLEKTRTAKKDPIKTINGFIGNKKYYKLIAPLKMKSGTLSKFSNNRYMANNRALAFYQVATPYLLLHQMIAVFIQISLLNSSKNQLFRVQGAIY
jgi:hypothetical protein